MPDQSSYGASRASREKNSQGWMFQQTPRRSRLHSPHLEPRPGVRHSLLHRQHRGATSRAVVLPCATPNRHLPKPSPSCAPIVFRCLPPPEPPRATGRSSRLPTPSAASSLASSRWRATCRPPRRAPRPPPRASWRVPMPTPRLPRPPGSASLRPPPRRCSSSALASQASPPSRRRRTWARSSAPSTSAPLPASRCAAPCVRRRRGERPGD